MKQNSSITESEWQVMQVIWAQPPKMLQEILASLKPTQWSTTTIQTYLARLVKKGVLSTERQGKGYLYFPTVSQRDCQIAEGTNFLERVYGGSLSRMVSGFVKSGNLSQGELQELKALIGQKEQDIAQQEQDHADKQ